MSYCINPDCGDRCNRDSLEYCQGCGSSLIICDRYRMIKPLRELDGQHQTEIFEIDDRHCQMPKILKVLTSNRRRLVELFEQESKILAQLGNLPVSQSDFFALGRTFVHLMTGIYPDKLPKTQTNQLIWRDRAPQIPSSLELLQKYFVV